jgi:hypothetical protein
MVRLFLKFKQSKHKFLAKFCLLKLSSVNLLCLKFKSSKMSECQKNGKCWESSYYPGYMGKLCSIIKLFACNLWRLIFLKFLYKIILSPWYPSIAALQTFKNDCCACIWDHW